MHHQLFKRTVAQHRIRNLNGIHCAMVIMGSDELRLRIDLLEKRMRKLEEHVYGAETEEGAESAPVVSATSRLRQAATQESGTVTPRTAPSGIHPLSEKELTVCMALKELRQPSSIEEINQHLAKTRFIKEAAKETLVMRIKGAVEKGVISFDAETKKFSLKTLRFIVE